MALFEKLDLCVHGAGYVRFYHRGTIFGMLVVVGWNTPLGSFERDDADEELFYT